MRIAYRVNTLLFAMLLTFLCGFVMAELPDPEAPSGDQLGPNSSPHIQWTQQGERSQRRRGFLRNPWGRGSAQNQKNHADVTSAYNLPAASTAKSIGQVLSDGKVVALATAVDVDGYLVTKASLLRKGTKLTVRLPGRTSDPITIVGQDEDFDLALLKVDGVKLQPVRWRTDAAERGTFVSATNFDGKVIGIGVISTEPRKIRGTNSPRRAWLGVTLGGGQSGRGVKEVIDSSAAKKAGVLSGDQIRAIDGAEMRDMDHIIATIGKSRPGDKITLLVQRDGDAMELPATLGKPPQSASPQDQWGGGPFSARREGFPEVLTHDTIIRPEQCGGPLVDTDGKVAGVNIARALRVTTYAIPAETVQRLVKELKKS